MTPFCLIMNNGGHNFGLQHADRLVMLHKWEGSFRVEFGRHRWTFRAWKIGGVNLTIGHSRVDSILLICCSKSHCSKVKMNGKKLNKFQFHFPGLLGTSLMSKQVHLLPKTDKWDYLRSPIIDFFFVSFLTLGKFLEALESGIGTWYIFCHSFSLSNNVFE